MGWVLKNWTHNAARQASGHQSESNEEEQSCAPDDGWFTAIGTLRQQAFLVDEVDDEKTESGTYAGYPVDEGYVDWHRIMRGIGRRLCV